MGLNRQEQIDDRMMMNTTIDYTEEITETETAIQSMTAEEAKDRQKWLEKRKRGIGGSDVASILGMSP